MTNINTKLSIPEFEFNRNGYFKDEIEILNTDETICLTVDIEIQLEMKKYAGSYDVEPCVDINGFNSKIKIIDVYSFEEEKSLKLTNEDVEIIKRQIENSIL